MNESEDLLTTINESEHWVLFTVNGENVDTRISSTLTVEDVDNIIELMYNQRQNK